MNIKLVIPKEITSDRLQEYMKDPILQVPSIHIYSMVEMAFSNHMQLSELKSSLGKATSHVAERLNANVRITSKGQIIRTKPVYHAEDELDLYFDFNFDDFDDFDDLQDQIAEFEDGVADLENDLDDIKVHVSELRDELTVLRNEIDGHVDCFDEFEDYIDNLEAQITSFEQKIEAMYEELADLTFFDEDDDEGDCDWSFCGEHLKCCSECDKNQVCHCCDCPFCCQCCKNGEEKIETIHSMEHVFMDAIGRELPECFFNVLKSQTIEVRMSEYKSLVQDLNDGRKELENVIAVVDELISR